MRSQLHRAPPFARSAFGALAVWVPRLSFRLASMVERPERLAWVARRWVRMESDLRVGGDLLPVPPLGPELLDAVPVDHRQTIASLLFHLP